MTRSVGGWVGNQGVSCSVFSSLCVDAVVEAVAVVVVAVAVAASGASGDAGGCGALCGARAFIVPHARHLNPVLLKSESAMTSGKKKHEGNKLIVFQSCSGKYPLL